MGALSNVRLVSLSEAKYLGMVLVENIMGVGGCPWASPLVPSLMMCLQLTCGINCLSVILK